MKILITGHLGFVGQATIKQLQNHLVHGYDILERNDIRDKQQFEAFVEDIMPDRILHLAAIARFADADADPKLAYETNVLGTKNVSDVAKKYHIPVVYSSTGSAIMPLNDYIPPFDETIPARGNSAYGCSKAVGEKYIREVNPHIILRYGHLLGAEKRFHGLIGGFLSRIERGAVPTLYGGQQTNSFVYIKDIAEANRLALEAPWDKWNQIYNIGSPEEVSAEEAGKLVCEIFDYQGAIEKKEIRTVDPIRFAMNTKKAEVMLGFKPKYSLRDGLLDMALEMGYNIRDGKATKPETNN